MKETKYKPVFVDQLTPQEERAILRRSEQSLQDIDAGMPYHPAFSDEQRPVSRTEIILNPELPTMAGKIFTASIYAGGSLAAIGGGFYVLSLGVSALVPYLPALKYGIIVLLLVAVIVLLFKVTPRRVMHEYEQSSARNVNVKITNDIKVY